MVKVKYILPIFAIMLAAIAWLLFLNKEAPIERFINKTIKQKPDTVISYINIGKTGKGKIFSEDSIVKGVSKIVFNKVDKDSASNFMADLKYYPETNVWDNRYSIPYKTIYEKETQDIKAVPNAEEHLWYLGIGANCRFSNTNFIVSPSISIGARLPYKALEVSFDLKVEPQLIDKGLQMNPSINGLLKIRF